MSLDDVPHDEMDERRHDEDDGFERLLEGSAEARGRLPELAVFVDDLQLISTVSPAVEDLHVAAMMSEAVHLFADKGDPVVRPVSNAQGPASQASGLPTRRSVQMKTLLAKVMAPLVAVFTVMGGLAYAEALPGSVQKAVSGAAGAVGIDLPDGSDDATVTDDPVGTDLDDDQGDKDGVEGLADDDSQGEDGDDQGENEDDASSAEDDDQGDHDESDDQREDDDSQGEDGDDQGEDGDDQGENEDNDVGSVEDDDQGHDESDDQGGHDESDDSGDDAGSDGDQDAGSGGDED